MLYSSAERVYERIKGHKVIVVGGGNNGIDVIRYFIARNVDVIGVFDNSKILQGKKIEGIVIERPHHINDDVKYVITTEQPVANEMRSQLLGLRIPEECIIRYYSHRSSEYLNSIPENDYKKEISDMFLERIGYDMNWESPRSYNEILNWEKIYCLDARRSRLADKWLVREWIKEKIGEEYLVGNIGAFDRSEEIDYSKLPNQFVLKVNNGSNRNIIVKDKSIINRMEINETLDRWCSDNYAFEMLEMHYKDIQPKIICEEYIKEFENGAVDYKLYCFQGEPVYIQRITNEHLPDAKALFYDLEWNQQEFNHYYPDDKVVSRPDFLNDMIRLTRILCREFAHVRVDWFALPDNRFLFGEMTFSCWAGLMRFRPQEYDLVLGNMITGKG